MNDIPPDDRGLNAVRVVEMFLERVRSADHMKVQAIGCYLLEEGEDEFELHSDEVGRGFGHMLTLASRLLKLMEEYELVTDEAREVLEGLSDACNERLTRRDELLGASYKNLLGGA